jgi:enediyne biosynthesis protein E8
VHPVTADLAVSRRKLLQLAAAAALTVPLAQLRFPVATAAPAPALPDPLTQTLEAWSDTMIPGEKRSPGDRAVAGAAAGPGAVQAGAIALMNFPPVGLAPALPALAAGLDAEATTYAASHNVVLDPTVPPFVALPFAHRTALALQLLELGHPYQLAWYGLAGIAFLAFHTAGHLDTVAAVRSGHPGLAWIDFPQPGPDGLWRYPVFSYRRVLARSHPRTTRSGSPA